MSTTADFKSMAHPSFRRAVEIRCAGNGGRCNAPLAVVFVPPLATSGGRLMPFRPNAPTLEYLIPADFSGECDWSLECPRSDRHTGVYTGGVGQWGPAKIEGEATRDRASGEVVSGTALVWPWELLRQPVANFRKNGRVQTILWSPRV